MDAYGENIIEKIHPFTGRIHADFKQLGTETGRFSCKDPNLQQMPKAFRECFISGEGYVFVGADYSQIELRILADVSGDDALSAAFKSGADVHVATAASMFNIPYADVTEEQRFAAKTLNFGIMYGMGVGKLMDSLNVEAEKTGQPKVNIRQVQAILIRYKKTYRKATMWLESAGRKALREGVSETMYGRKRFYTRPISSLDRELYDKTLKGIERQGANSPIQGTCADITKIAMLSLYNNLKEYGYRGNIVLQVHDEIVVLAHKTQAEPIKELVVESMMVAAESILKNIPIKVDAYISEIWKK
jgi:DNA polymerase-1